VSEHSFELRRTLACELFCAQVPTEVLERLLDLRVGAATILEWLKRLEHGMQTMEETRGVRLTYDACWQCSTLRPGHAEDCLLGKAMATYKTGTESKDGP
jgi:hypothetical protein